MEHYTFFRIAVPVSTETTAAQMARIVELHLIAVFGPPSQLCSDGASTLLVSRELKTLCQQYGIRSHVGTPYNSQSQGLVEKSNRSVTQITAMLALAHKLPWTHVLSRALWLLNAKPVTGLQGLTPFEMMYGQRALRPQIEFANEDFPTRKETLTFHRDLDLSIARMRVDLEKDRLALNAHTGGKEWPLPRNSLIYIRDHAKHPTQNFMDAT